jgi:hypothetical protein
MSSGPAMASRASARRSKIAGKIFFTFRITRLNGGHLFEHSVTEHLELRHRDIIE